MQMPHEPVADANDRPQEVSVQLQEMARNAQQEEDRSSAPPAPPTGSTPFAPPPAENDQGNNNDPDTELAIAARSGQIATVRNLLESSAATVDERCGEGGQFALMHAARLGHTAIDVETDCRSLPGKHNMTPLEGALLVQRLVRGQRVRKTVLNIMRKLHIQYEIKIIEQRQERRKLVSQFLMHVIYMTIMVSVFILQHGHSVRSRYSMVAVLKQYVDSTITPTGIAFETIRTIPDVWDWTEALIAKTAVSMVAVPEDEDEDADADTQTEATGVDSRWVVPDEDADAEIQHRQLKTVAVARPSVTAAAAEGGAAAGVGMQLGRGTRGRVFIRTYNQLVGTVRIETLRVDADSCEYKSFPWAQQILKQRRPALTASDTTTCYGSKMHPSTTPFGPWYDPTRWSVHEKPGDDARYIIDLGKDPTFARLKIAEGRHDKFLSEYTRRVVISFVIYNNALPLFCYCRLVIEVTPTGEFHNAFHMEGMNVQEYTDSYWWVQVMLELQQYLFRHLQ